MSTKLPYHVPSMAEIAKRPPNGFKMISTFAGCGGSSLGYKMAGFRILWANEYVADARKVYAANHPGTILDERDIRAITVGEILACLGLHVGELDLLDGSPPCASYSTVGKVAKLWNKTKKYSTGADQRTDDLFEHYVRLVIGLKPKSFVAENVSGLVKGAGKGAFIEILDAFAAAGYVVEARLVDAQWLGVPQARERIIFVGVRRDLVDAHGLKPAFPEPLAYRYSLAEAFDGLPVPSAEEVRAVDISAYAIGKAWSSTRPGHSSDRYFSLVRPRFSEPCPTITAKFGDVTAASVVHPTEKRKFTTAELKRICSFPDDFTFSGNWALDAERMGRAVPPLMMEAIATAVRDNVLAKIPAA